MGASASNAKWVNLLAGTPLAPNFATTGGLGSPICVDKTTAVPYILINNAVIPLGGGMRVTPQIFGAKLYNSANPVDAADALNRFFTFIATTNNARWFVFDWSGEWYTAKPVYAIFNGSDPDAIRRIVCGTLRVAPIAELPGGVAMFAAITVASYYADWQGRMAIQEAGPHPVGNTTYYTRRFRHGARFTQMAMSSVENPVVVDGAIRDGVLFEGREAGITIDGHVLGGQNSIGARFGGAIARFCGTCQHYQANQGPTPLVVTAVSHGSGSGTLWSNTEVYTAGTGGFANADAQRSKITVGSGTTTADLEINDQILRRLELIPAIYGTIQAIPDADPRTGTLVWTAGDPTNVDGAGNGLKVGDIYPIFQAGPNIGIAFVITGFSGGSNRTIAVAVNEIYNLTIVMVVDAATNDPARKQYGPWSMHWVSRVIDGSNFAVTPWLPNRANSVIQIYNGAALHADGEDLANVAIGSVIGNICGKAYYVRSNFAPTADTVLGQVCGIGLHLGDPSYFGGIGNVIKHGHAEGCLFDMVSGDSHVGGSINMSSLFDLAKTVAYCPRATTNDQEPTFPRFLGGLTITGPDGVLHEPQYGGTRESPGGQDFVSNSKFYRLLYADGSFPTIEIRYDTVEADRFVKNHWAEIVVLSDVGGVYNGSITLTLSKKLQAQGWTFNAGGTSFIAAAGNQPYKLRLFYQASQKKIGVQRSQYFLDSVGDFYAPNNLYIGKSSGGAAYVDGKELVLRNTSGYGLRVAMNGATSALYMDNQQPGVGYSEFNIRGLPLVLWGDGAAITATVNAAGINLAAGKVLQVNGTSVVGPRGTAVAAPAGGATIDAESRTAINALISRLQAHGLIA